MATMYYRPYTAEPQKDDELPSMEAVESILPDYQYIFVNPAVAKPPIDDPPATREPRSPRHEPRSPTKEPQPSTSHVDSPPLVRDSLPQYLADHHMKELENYRTAVHKMGQDLLALRDRLRASEAANSRLRSDLARYDDTTKLMLDSSELDGVTKPELATRYASLKQKLSSQTNELKAYKDKVCHLQNEIIKKNDEAKDFLSIRNAHQSQQATMHKLQERSKKVKKLEDTCRKQEKVIEKLELIIDKQKGKRSDGLPTEAHDALLAENRRLRGELTEAKEQLHDQGTRNPADDTRMLDLHQMLEKGDGRILALEKQMDNNAKEWGRERAELMLRLRESESGFRPTVGISDPMTGRFLEQYQPQILKQRRKSGNHKSAKNNYRL